MNYCAAAMRTAAHLERAMSARTRRQWLAFGDLRKGRQRQHILSAASCARWALLDKPAVAPEKKLNNQIIMPATCDIGLIGLAVMGENLALNMESRGYHVAVFNRTTKVVDDFIAGLESAPTPDGSSASASASAGS